MSMLRVHFRVMRNTGAGDFKEDIMPNMSKALVGAGGEFYVLFRLHAAGLVAAAAPRNAERVDIFAFRPADRTRVVDLQVKTRTEQSSEGGWMMNQKHEELVDDRLYYVFVDMENRDHPPCFIIPSKLVADVVRTSHATWLALPKLRGEGPKKLNNRVRRVLPAYRHEVPGFEPGWMEHYRDAWHLVFRP
jgi:hypothetical protein